MKKIISAFTLLLLVFAIPTEISGEDFDGLEGVIVLNPSDEDAKTSSNTSNSTNEGLDLTVKENTVERISETYSNIILNVSLMNWDVSGYQLDDAVSAQLYYQDQFEYPATMDFHGETEIGMLVNLDGTLTFTVPNIVAMADKDSIELELVVLGETYTEELDLTAAAKKVFEEVGMPFDYENRENDELELHLGSAQMLDTWKEEKDEKYKWIIQEISMINWSGSQKKINGSLYALLTYMDEYGFEAQVEFPQEQLDSLEMVQGNLIFHVPVIVTTAEEGTLTLQMNLLDNEWVEDFDIRNVSKPKVRSEVTDESKKAYVGIIGEEVTSDASMLYGIPQGICVTSVSEGTPAKEAGIQKGDVITKFDGNSVSDMDELRERLVYYEAGETVKMTIEREENEAYVEKEIEITLGAAVDY